MGWLIKDRRGVSWADIALNSISAPPVHLLALLSLVIILMSISTFSELKVHLERQKMGLKLLAFFLPVALLLVADVTMRFRWSSRPAATSQEGNSPWGVAFLVILLLVLVKYHSSVQASWF